MTAQTDFMIIGVQKCGTTSLAYLLSQHPAVDFCSQKEPDFFSKHANWQEELDQYHALFRPSKIGVIRGEASTTYSWLLEYPDTPARLFEYNAQLKLIYIMRDPVERVRSHYIHEDLKGRTKTAFAQEIMDNPTYLNHSRYAIQIRAFLELFGRQQIHFMTLESLIKTPKQALKEIAVFLGISSSELAGIDYAPQNVSHKNLKVRRIKRYLAPFGRFLPLRLRLFLRRPLYRQSQTTVKWPDGLRRYIWRFVEDDVAEIEEISGLRLDEWRLANGVDPRWDDGS